jgi:hypothetical protein
MGVLAGCSGESPVRESGEETLEVLQKKYRRASTEREKLELCIAAINREVIHRGCPVKDVEALFGTSLTEEGLPEKGAPMARGVVDFGKFLKPPADDVAGGWEGWYLVVIFDHVGKVQNYYLSNLHK